MLRYVHTTLNESMFVALIGLINHRFQDLMPLFVQYMRTRAMDGLEQIGCSYTPYRSSPLPIIEDKMLFMLVYLKQAPAHTFHGRFFDLCHSNINMWLHLLYMMPNQTLAMHGALPPWAATISMAEPPATTASDGTVFFPRNSIHQQM